MSIVSVNCENLESNPHCPHGPTLKFSRLVKGKVKTFFACSACRDRKDCPFFLWEDEKITCSKQLALEENKKEKFPEIHRDKILRRLEDFKRITSKKQFCVSCCDFILPNECSQHQNHSLKAITSNEILKTPTKLLTPLMNDKNEAQYWFSSKTARFIVDNYVKIEFTKAVCVGAPTIHEVMQSRNFRSLLLDLDHRYHWFYGRDKFLWFNMFNFHFLDNSEDFRDGLEKFLLDSTALIIIDPPFGARIEPLKYTICKLQQLCAKKLHTMLILPYFMEPQVLDSFPNFKMLDFPVEYDNHKKFKNKSHVGTRKGSPIRIFTDIFPKKFTFPENEGYHFCSTCEAWRSKLNVHCELCTVCPSKNGDAYKHCVKCFKCVKQTWKHCESCKKCILPDHTCNVAIRIENCNRKKKRK